MDAIEIEKRRRALTAEFFPDVEKPPTLFHYTNRETTQIMLEKRTLRATQVRFMNDSEEAAHGRRIIGEAIRERTSNASATAIEQHLGENEVVFRRSFMMCFSEDPDSLSQWRGYGEDGSGFAVGIDATQLPEHHGEEGARCVREVVASPDRVANAIS